MIFGPDIELHRDFVRKAGILLDNNAANFQAPDLGLEISPAAAPIWKLNRLACGRR